MSALVYIINSSHLKGQNTYNGFISSVLLLAIDVLLDLEHFKFCSAQFRFVSQFVSCIIQCLSTKLHCTLPGIMRKMLVLYRDVYHLILQPGCAIVNNAKIIIIFQTTKTFLLNFLIFFLFSNLLDIIIKNLFQKIFFTKILHAYLVRYYTQTFQKHTIQIKGDHCYRCCHQVFISSF